MTPSKTTFGGLEVLAPGDPLSSDGYAFQSENPLITALLLQIGAVLHKHDAHAAMADPTAAPTVAVAATGGQIASGTSIYVQYTLTDAQGGETLPVAVVQVITASGYADPTGAPDATVDFSAGSMLASTPMYAVSVTDGLGGETALGPPISVTVNPATNAEVVLSGLTAITNTSSGTDPAAGWRLWRSMDGGNTWDLMSTGGFATDGYTDDGTSPGDCSVTPLTVGTTGNTGELTVTVPSAGQPSGAEFFNLYASTDGTFTNPALLGTYPITDFDAAQTFTQISTQAGSPPAVSTCIGGANQIDPDTDMIAWPWKKPVAAEADLPTTGNSDGDMRVSLDTYTLYVWEAGASTWVGGGGAVGPAGPTGPTGPTGPAASAQVPVNSVTGDYTLALGDAGVCIEMDGGTLTIPANDDVTFPLDTIIEVCQVGATTPITIVGVTEDLESAPVTITIDLPPGTTAVTAGQWATVGLRQRATNEWLLSGNLAT